MTRTRLGRSAAALAAIAMSSVFGGTLPIRDRKRYNSERTEVHNEYRLQRAKNKRERKARLRVSQNRTNG